MVKVHAVSLVSNQNVSLTHLTDGWRACVCLTIKSTGKDTSASGPLYEAILNLIDSACVCLSTASLPLSVEYDKC